MRVQSRTKDLWWKQAFAWGLPMFHLHFSKSPCKLCFLKGKNWQFSHPKECSIYSSLPRIMTITKGLSAVIGFAQIEVFQVAEYPDYTFTHVSAGFSFGFGMGFIQQGGKITFNHKASPLETLRARPRFVWLSSVMSPVIHIFWVICYITVSSSPILVLLFD